MAELRRGMTHGEAAAHLREEVTNTANREIAPLLLMPNNSGPPSSGYFSVVRSVFTETDYLGALYSGWNGARRDKIATTPKAVRFVREVYAAASGNALYESHGKLLVEMYRMGTVHLHAPKTFENVNNSTPYLGWALMDEPSGTDPNTGDALEHLTLHQLRRWPDMTVLPVSVTQLFDDFLRAVEHFANLLDAEQACRGTTQLGLWRQTADALSEAEEKPNLSW